MDLSVTGGKTHFWKNTYLNQRQYFQESRRRELGPLISHVTTKIKIKPRVKDYDKLADTLSTLRHLLSDCHEGS